MAEQPQWVKFIVRLTAAERTDLQRLVDEGKRAGSVLKRAWVLLKADADGPNWRDPQIAEAYGISLSTIHRVRQAFVEEGLEERCTARSPRAGSITNSTAPRRPGCWPSPAASRPPAASAGRCKCLPTGSSR